MERSEEKPLTGSCLCGAVRYEVRRPLRDVVNCHCSRCRKSHGHISAYTNAPRAALTITESRGLKWYRTSPSARQGFCGECGGTLFWERDGADVISITAGTLDPPTGLKTMLQIFVNHAGDYYEIPADIPQRGD